jgi:hypothetical protein
MIEIGMNTKIEDAGVKLVEAFVREALNKEIDKAVETGFKIEMADRNAILERMTPAITTIATEFVEQRRNGNDVTLDEVAESLVPAVELERRPFI